uniref:Uncharacterized protein n=1 Tax=Quercus lobata TaxID=97700 RepID=A0A7N2LM90_QUELO
MGKEGAIRLLTYVEDLMSNTRPKNFARTFRDGNKVFILQLGFNAHGSFLMIFELLHGRQKGLIVVPEGKLGSGRRGFGFHLCKAIAPDTLVVKPPSQSALFPTVQQFRNQKSFLSAAVDGDWRTNGGSGTGKHAMPNIQNSIKSNQSIKSSLSSQKTQNQDLCDRGAGDVESMREAQLVFIGSIDNASDVVDGLQFESKLLSSDESVEARNGLACTTDSDESLVRDLLLILQEHSGNIVKKWGNSEQWILELRDGRWVVVPL